MGQDPNSIKVFISYSHEDSEKAKRLYSKLKEWNVDPWFDQESLRAGEKWEVKIKEAIKNSQYFIPVLSKNSTEETGYVLKELNDAIKILKELPDSKIYIIPIRVDDCQVLESTVEELQKIQELHIVDLFPDEEWNKGFQKILDAMGIEDKPDKLGKEYWESLLTDIDKKECIPVIGDGSLESYDRQDDEAFLTTKEIALELAEKNDYPLDDPSQLSKVTQYLAIRENNEMYPKNVVSNMLGRLKPPDFANKYRRSLHAVLTKLNLPIYITTTYDLFMEEALKSDGKEPHSECCRWNDDLRKLTTYGGFPSVFDKKSGYKIPTEKDPLVYHLHGSIEYPNSMVLTERDYFDFVINMNKIEDEKVMLPSVLRTKITQSTLLFLGYRLDDIDFRSIFQGALSFYASTRGMKNNFVIIQLPDIDDYGKRKKVIQYLRDKSKNMFHLIVYWGSIDEFVEELLKNWEKFKNG
ncbi:MAG TPA: TIR domain-containing protein [Nitrososphaeraceae archaeon]|nr:TIR domain-containing protein [Nitrososphaeraceae archaeon]